jgi:thiol-disulfide isomerase/thioredoxin
MRLVVISCALLALAACHKASEPNTNRGAQTAPAGVPVKGIDRTHKGQPAPNVTFNDPDGNEIRLSAFAGKPTLVNLWASWCAPCVKELPTLDKLARAEDGKLNVVAISQDMGPHASVEAFLKTHGIAMLESYQDPKMGLSGALGAEVLPTSILLDSSGKEVWRYVGDQDWTSAEAARLVSEGGVAQPR